MTKNTSEYKLPKMMTIKQTADTGILPEHALRIMVKRGEIPHIKIGVKTLINFDLLVQKLNSLERGEIGSE